MIYCRYKVSTLLVWTRKICNWSIDKLYFHCMTIGNSFYEFMWVMSRCSTMSRSFENHLFLLFVAFNHSLSKISFLLKLHVQLWCLDRLPRTAYWSQFLGFFSFSFFPTLLCKSRLSWAFARLGMTLKLAWTCASAYLGLSLKQAWAWAFRSPGLSFGAPSSICFFTHRCCFFSDFP